MKDILKRRYLTSSNPIIAKMKSEVRLLGTELLLLKGQLVECYEALNIPGGGWFVSPVGGLWPAPAPPQDPDTSILIDPCEEDDYLEFKR